MLRHVCHVYDCELAVTSLTWLLWLRVARQSCELRIAALCTLDEFAKPFNLATSHSGAELSLRAFLWLPDCTPKPAQDSRKRSEVWSGPDTLPAEARPQPA